MDAEWPDRLAQVAVESFGTLGFMFPLDEAEAGAAGSLIEPITVAVSFHGPRTGWVTLTAPSGLLPILAANMTGDDGPISAEVQQDAFKEMLNVICGNLLPQLAGAEAVFDVGSPKIVDGQNGLLAVGPTATARLLLDAGQVDVALFLAEVVKV